MTTGKQGSMSVRVNGTRYMVCYQPIPDTPSSLALVCPEWSILQGYNRLNYIIGPLILLGLLFILLYCSVTVAHAVHPLYRLTSKLHRIAEGHYDEQIPPSRYHDVVGRLQNSFASMQESLSRHVSDIQQMHAEMEQRNEELARTSEQAREADRQKSLFIQNVSHQIRTPLNIIMGFAQVLEESNGMLPEEETKSITDMMKHNAQMLDRMVLMLSDSSIRGSMQELYANRNEVVSCNEVASECIGYTNKMFPQLPVEFVTDVPDDFSITTSHLYLMRSIRELLYNAAKYSDGQNILIRVTEMGSNVRFVVQDTGPGIEEEMAGRMFEMFTKVNDISEGLGLGLALARRHIRNLGGEMFLDLDYHDGCRFVIELPKL